MEINNQSKLIAVKLLHTLIWIGFNIIIFYLLYAVIINRIDLKVWICLSLIFAEVLVLIIFRNICPVTFMARRYSQSEKANFDIYIPELIAKYNKQIYGSIVLIAVIILVIRLLNKGN